MWIRKVLTRAEKCFTMKEPNKSNTEKQGYCIYDGIIISFYEHYSFNEFSKNANSMELECRDIFIPILFDLFGDNRGLRFSASTSVGAFFICREKKK